MILPSNLNSNPNQRLGYAWLALTCALALHVLDEALTGFLPIYNATVLALRAEYLWFPMPTFTFPVWLSGLILLIVVMLALSPLFFRGVRWVRPIGYFMAVLNVLNALGHTTETIFGRTVSTIHFQRPAPGFYSSPFLFLASVFLLLALRRSRQQDTSAAFASN